MKKSIIALAVAGAMTAPMIAQANPTVYGLVEVRAMSFEDQDFDVQATKVELGVKGNIDIKKIEDLTAGYQIEWRFDGAKAAAEQSTGSSSTIAMRKAHVWLSGDWGRADFGQQNNPANVATWSILNRNHAFFINTADRINNGVVYWTPKMGGFQAGVGIGVDGGRGQDVAAGKDGDDADLTTFGATFGAGGLGLGLGYMDVTSTSDSDSNDDGYSEMSAKVTYKLNDLTVGASFYDKDFDAGAGTADYSSALVGANYMLSAATSIHAEYSEKDSDTDTSDNDLMAVGMRYRLDKGAMIIVEYADYDLVGDNLIVEYQLNF